MSLLTSILVFVSPITYEREKARNKMQEVWEDVIGYEQKYKVSNLGNVKSLNYRGHGYEKNLKQRINNKGYVWYLLSKNKRTYPVLAHRLVAMAFIDNPENLPEVNHKDENPLNNSVENLEWCNSSYNVNYSLNLHPDRRKREKIRSSEKYKRRNKKVIQINLHGDKIRQHKSVNEIKKTYGYNSWSIIQCCENRRKTAYGYRWEFAD